MEKTKCFSQSDLASYIDHAVLDPQLTIEQLKEKMMIGVHYGCQSICVNPGAIDIAKECIQNSKTNFVLFVIFLLEQVIHNLN